MGEGWISLYRKLLDKPIWKNSTPEQCKIFITLLLMANHNENEWEWQGQKFKVEPGQFVTSLDNIVRECGKGISIQNVRNALDKFKKYGFLTYESTKTGRLVTIVNWRVYQSENNKTNKDYNKGITKNQQRHNKEVTANNNDNNEINNYMSDSDEYKLAEYLYKHILKNNPKAKEPNLQNWAQTFDYVLRLDKRELEEVKKLIKFSQQHKFWYKNILSPSKLRKQYDRLILEMNEEKNKFENTDIPVPD